MCRYLSPDERTKIQERVRDAGFLSLFLDFDGTLTPIVADPAEARLDPRVRGTLQSQAARDDTLLAFVSGRALDDLRPRVGIERAVYAGNHGLEITGALSAGEAGGPHALDRRIDSDELRNLIRGAGISRIVLAEPDPRRRAALGAALLGCRLSGVTIEDAVDFYEKLSRKIWLQGVHPEWLIHSDGFHPSKFYMAIKRAFDVFFSLLLVLAASPVLLLIAAAIKLDSEGPVLFRQERVGLDGREFVLFKFRSMRHDAEQTTGPTWAHPNDARVTRLGRVLRKFRLDELPQAFNVLCGEMSFVGPRPERPYFVALLREKIRYYDLRHYVKPGITGWAQVMYPYGSCIEDAYEKLQYDFYYAKHISFGIDVVILLKTLKVVVFGKGR